jgi:hypothetical protein
VEFAARGLHSLVRVGRLGLAGARGSPSARLLGLRGDTHGTCRLPAIAIRDAPATPLVITAQGDPAEFKPSRSSAFQLPLLELRDQHSRLSQTRPRCLLKGWQCIKRAR